MFPDVFRGYREKPWHKMGKTEPSETDMTDMSFSGKLFSQKIHHRYSIGFKYLSDHYLIIKTMASEGSRTGF